MFYAMSIKNRLPISLHDYQFCLLSIVGKEKGHQTPAT